MNLRVVQNEMGIVHYHPCKKATKTDIKNRILRKQIILYQSRRTRLFCGGLISYLAGLRLYRGGKSRPAKGPLGYCRRN